MKKSILFLASVILIGCNNEELTVYDYLNNKELLDKDFSDCVSGKISDDLKCNTVKKANSKYSFFIKGLYSEQDLKEFGKK